MEDGVALDLRSEGSPVDVASLRDEVQHIVDAWNSAEVGVRSRCSDPSLPRTATGGSAVDSSIARLENIAEGCRVVFKPLARADLNQLRAQVRAQKQETLACACGIYPREAGIRSSSSGPR